MLIELLHCDKKICTGDSYVCQCLKVIQKIGVVFSVLKTVLLKIFP